MAGTGKVKLPWYTSKTFRTVVRTVTPGLAEAIEERCSKLNRPRRPNAVIAYAIEMESGEWDETVNPIHISWPFEGAPFGAVVNGQHRLAAVVLYGSPVKMQFNLGVDPKSYAKHDSPQTRSSGDLIYVGRGGSITAASRKCSIMRCALLGFRSNVHTLTKEGVAACTDEYLEDVTLVYDVMRKVKPYVPAVLGGFLACSLHYGRDRVMPLAEMLATMAYPTLSHPIKRLYERVVTEKTNAKNRVTSQSMRPAGYYALTICAISASVRGVTSVKALAPAKADLDNTASALVPGIGRSGAAEVRRMRRQGKIDRLVKARARYAPSEKPGGLRSKLLSRMRALKADRGNGQ
jgi:hypothetical protein